MDCVGYHKHPGCRCDMAQHGELIRLTLFDLGGGHYGPDNWRSSVVSTWVALHSPNLLDLFLSMLDTSRKFDFRFFQRYQTYPKNIQRDPSMQKSKFSEFFVFSFKISFFCLNLNCHCIAMRTVNLKHHFRFQSKSPF